MDTGANAFSRSFLQDPRTSSVKASSFKAFVFDVLNLVKIFKTTENAKI